MVNECTGLKEQCVDLREQCEGMREQASREKEELAEEIKQLILHALGQSSLTACSLKAFILYHTSLSTAQGFLEQMQLLDLIVYAAS